MEPINININPMTPREALGIANDLGIAARAVTLGFVPEIIKNQSSLVLPMEVAGGTRLIKLVYLPLHLKGVIDHSVKSFEERKAHKRDIHVASALNNVACVVEDAGLIGIGLDAVKLMASKTLLAVASWLSSVGLFLQIVSVYSDYRKIKNSEIHLQGIEKDDPNYLEDKTKYNSFSDAVGFKRKVINGFMERVIDKSIKNNDKTLVGHLIANLKTRIELGILTRKLGIIITICFTAAVIIHLIPPLALVGWGLIGLLTVATLSIGAYRLINTYYLNKDLARIISPTAA